MRTSIQYLVFISILITWGCDQQSRQDSHADGADLNPRIQHSEVQIPDEPIAGQLMGQSFQPDHTEISELNSLDFWIGDRMFPSAKVSISLPIPYGKSPEGNTWNFFPDENAPRQPIIQISMKSNSGAPVFKTFNNQYRLMLSFGTPNERQLIGRIYLDLPENQTKIAGIFLIERPENPAQLPKNHHRPYIYGRIGFSSPKMGMLSAGYSGMGSDGAIYHNSAGLSVLPNSNDGSGHVLSTTFKPRTTAMWRDQEGRMNFRHVHLKPGIYAFIIRWENHLIAYRWYEVIKDSNIIWNIDIDLSKSGSLFISIPGKKKNKRVWLVPLNNFGVLPQGIDHPHLWKIPFHLQVKPEYDNGIIQYRLLPPAEYIVLFKNKRKHVKVKAGEIVKIKFQNQ